MNRLVVENQNDSLHQVVNIPIYGLPDAFIYLSNIVTLSQGDIFAAPALLGNAIAPATVTAESDVQVLTINREVLLVAIGQNPEIALQILTVFNQPILYYSRGGKITVLDWEKLEAIASGDEIT
ncbi:cyclic nucleotide-binding domain-containing protein [Tychonema sp. BBK16]|uniref:cyclic nucleotide-binding domain-containing protein n=1 Tax=Tychonema sp. BBK16 TaxID=2699888 RepID=UPI001F363A24|nr:cyclic nucleotide-binding domain-containing protein [Tychonema sp. BBK16]MCF6374750.1 cyclic nucleotide-binding domain-containing protein [Tychonema sp. BBK16]